MNKKLSYCFRQDIVFSPTQNESDRGKSYLVTDPISGETFEFGEEEFFLCQSLDGTATPDLILAKFNARFGQSLTEEYLQSFIAQIDELGLLESCEYQPENNLLAAENDSIERELAEVTQEETDIVTKTNNSDLQWCFFNPGSSFNFLALNLKYFRSFFVFLCWSLIPGVPIALYSYFNNQFIIWQDISLLKEPTSYLSSFLFNLLLLNLSSRIVQGTVCAFYGLKIKEFGLRLRLGVLPLFYIDKSEVKDLDRAKKLWIYGTPLLLRLLLFVFGIFIWHLVRGTGNELGIFAISLAQAGLFSCLIIGSPFLPADGYRWWVTYLNLPASSLRQALQIGIMTLTNQPLPTSISTKKKFIFLIYGFVLFFIWGLLLFKLSSSTLVGIAESFPDVLGRGTFFILWGLFFLMLLRWLGSKLFKGEKRKAIETKKNLLVEDLADNNKKSNLQKCLKLFFLFVLGIIMVLPVPYNPGGQIELLSSQKQKIQAPITGKIVRVLHNGGDSKVLAAETVIAKIVSTEIENNIATLQEQIKEQIANIQTQKAITDKLLAEPRKEEVEIARAKVRVAQQEVEIARRQLTAAIVSARYSQETVKRLESLYDSGAVALQLIEEAKRQAELDKISIEEKSQNLSAKQKQVEATEADLQLILSGSSPEDIEASLQQLEAARAELRRLQQELKYAQNTQKTSDLVMPFQGILLDSQLNDKIGSYLNLGETFATVQKDTKPLAELELPEYEAPEIYIETPAVIKLLAYPSEPISGKVISIEPATSEEIYGGVFKVLIKLEDSNKILKSGMTGYGKIYLGEKPVIVLLTRPIVRFVQIELWSWLP